ncbi:hypothetical protein KIPB_014579, partial [Kipferlia bialata]|eukprot:g14579.t1
MRRWGGGEESSESGTRNMFDKAVGQGPLPRLVSTQASQPGTRVPHAYTGPAYTTGASVTQPMAKRAPQ